MHTFALFSESNKNKNISNEDIYKHINSVFIAFNPFLPKRD